jgi:hypothetical protein
MSVWGGPRSNIVQPAHCLAAENAPHANQAAKKRGAWLRAMRLDK